MKHVTIALYLLALIHLAGLSAFLTKEFRADVPRYDYRESVEIVDSYTTVKGAPYLNLKLINTEDFHLDDISILVNVYDTNDTHIRTIEEHLFSAYPPHEEAIVSIRLGYDEDDYIEGGTYKPIITSASKVE